jgi:hypothetical protein
LPETPFSTITPVEPLENAMPVWAIASWMPAPVTRLSTIAANAPRSGSPASDGVPSAFWASTTMPAWL